MKFQFSILIFLIGLFGSFQSKGQNECKFIVELDLIKFQKGVGIFESYFHRYTYFQGLEVGYILKPRIQIFTGISLMKQGESSLWGGDTWEEVTTTNAFEIACGIETNLCHQKRIFFSFTFEIFSQTAHLEGTVLQGGPPEYIINHSKHFYGFAFDPKINCRINKSFQVSVSPRFRIGYLRLKYLPEQVEGPFIWSDSRDFHSIADPLNALSLKYSF